MPNLALFDFDGTITTTDCFTLFVKKNVSNMRLILFYPIILPFVWLYKANWLSGSYLRQMIVFFAFAGKRSVTLQVMADRFAVEEIPKLVNLKVWEILEAHRRQGDKIVIVSASLCLYLRPWAGRENLEFYANELADCGGYVTGFYRQRDCSGMEKAIRVKTKLNLSEYSKIYAYGNSDEDKELLDLASEKVWVE